LLPAVLERYGTHQNDLLVAMFVVVNKAYRAGVIQVFAQNLGIYVTVSEAGYWVALTVLLLASILSSWPARRRSRLSTA